MLASTLKSYPNSKIALAYLDITVRVPILKPFSNPRIEIIYTVDSA